MSSRLCKKLEGAVFHSRLNRSKIEDYSMFEGIEVKSMSDVVLSREQVVVEGEKFHGKPGQRSFPKRAVYNGV
jgi:hypothetical protein